MNLENFQDRLGCCEISETIPLSKSIKTVIFGKESLIHNALTYVKSIFNIEICCYLRPHGEFFVVKAERGEGSGSYANEPQPEKVRLC